MTVRGLGMVSSIPTRPVPNHVETAGALAVGELSSPYLFLRSAERAARDVVMELSEDVGVLACPLGEGREQFHRQTEVRCQT